MSERPVAWRRVSLGLYLMGLGILLLLSTQGHLRWSFWHEAVSFWPVLLVGVGIRVVFERTRAAWLVLLSPAVVLGTLVAIAVYGPAKRVEASDRIPVRVERNPDAQTWTLVGRWHDAQLDLRAGDLEGDLVRGWRSPEGDGSVRESADDGEVRVTVENRHRGPRWLLPRRRSAWELELEKSLTLELDLELVMTEGGFDLAPAQLSRVELDGALNDLRLRLGQPTEDVRVEISGAFSNYELVVPGTTPVEVDTDGPFIRVDGRPGARALQGPGYRVYVEGAFNRLVVSSAGPGQLERERAP